MYFKVLPFGCQLRLIAPAMAAEQSLHPFPVSSKPIVGETQGKAPLEKMGTLPARTSLPNPKTRAPMTLLNT